MTQRSTFADVGAMYDQMTDLFTEVLGGSIHLGYWDGDEDDSPIAAASARMTELVADRLILTPGQHVLDIGCGNGTPAVQIATGHDVHVTGITVSAHQLHLAQARTLPTDLPGQVSFHLADAMDLPFDDASFDGAYAIESIVHMNDRDAALGHIARVLRPGARLGIADVHLDEPVTARDAELVANVCGIWKIPDVPSAGSYREHLRRAGFTDLEFTDIREKVHRTYDLVAEGFRRAATSFDGDVAAQLAGSATLIEQFGKLTSLGYFLLTAVRA